MSRPGARRAGAGFCLLVAVVSTDATRAHSGPPFPLFSNRASGPYTISVWADPDSTDDGTPGGQFWITVRPTDGAVPLPVATRIAVTSTPRDRPGQPATISAHPVADDPSQRFAALVMDHEGRFLVRVTIDGPLGAARVEAEVDATYDLRPSPAMIALYLIPFVLVGFLWVKLLLRRRSRSMS